MTAVDDAGFDAVVLAGGRARRLDGAAKPQQRVGGVRLVDRVLAATAGAGVTVLVGPEQPVGPVPGRFVRVREDPPGGGPVAAIGAAVPLLGAPVTLVLAADLPWIAGAVPALRAAVPGAGVAVLTGPDGRRNLLAAAWRTDSLRAAVAVAGGAGAAVRSLFAATPEVVEVLDEHRWGGDCDTWEDLHRAAADARAAADPPV